MTKKNQERFDMLEQQKKQLEANLFKVMGAMELLTAMDAEDAEELKKNKVSKGGTYSGSKKIKN